LPKNKHYVETSTSNGIDKPVFSKDTNQINFLLGLKPQKNAFGRITDREVDICNDGSLLWLIWVV
jgi:hypothetical protein